MKAITIVCVGQPNVGKSSLVNEICGVHLKVGNFTGVTVEKAEARIEYRGQILRFIDLPGTYSLNDYSFEEHVTKQYLETQDYDVILNVLDSTNLERCLLLTTQLLELNAKMCLALNMSDEAKNEHIDINEALLGEILGVKCVSVSAIKSHNINALLDAIIEVAQTTKTPNKRVYSEVLESEIENLSAFLREKNYDDIKRLIDSKHKGLESTRDVAIKLLMQDNFVSDFLHNKGYYSELSAFVNSCVARIYTQSKENNMRDIFNADALSFAKGASVESSKVAKTSRLSLTQRIDNILLNKYLGIPIFLFFMWLLFQTTFYLGEYPKVWIEDSMASLGDYVSENMPGSFLPDLIAGGIIAGVGAVLSFLPHILILFCGITILEGTGYMARVAFLLDGFFHKFGLHGKSFIPLVTGFGCSVPAYMSTRMLKNNNDRMLTLFIINFMSCSARLPVYTLFIGTFFKEQWAGNMLFIIYIFGALVGLIMAKVLKLSAFKGDDEPFVMEMPKYRMPTLRLIGFGVYRKAISYVKKAGTFILLASIIIWVGTQFPKSEALESKKLSIIEPNEAKIIALQEQLESMLDSSAESKADSNAKDLIEAEIEALNSANDEAEAEYNAKLVEQSYLGRLGGIIAPIFAPLDFDWRISVALLNGLLAKETIVSSLGVLYGLGDGVDENNDAPLRDVLKDYISLPSAVAFIMFIMFYNPCFAATIVFGKEAGGRRFIAYLFIFTSVVSYIFAWLGFEVASVIVA